MSQHKRQDGQNRADLHISNPGLDSSGSHVANMLHALRLLYGCEDLCVCVSGFTVGLGLGYRFSREGWG